MHDAIMTAFLRRQHEDAGALVRESDFVEIAAHKMCSDRFLVRFTCRGLVKASNNSIVEASAFLVGITFPANYLRAAEPQRVVTWVGPSNVWHPNIAGEAQLICVGRVTPGTGLVDLIYQCWEIITWNKVTMREEDALNPSACEWARNNLTRFPVERRPLKRRAFAVQTHDFPSRAAHA